MNQASPHPQVALVTGAAGGLGQALVQELAAQGWLVAAGTRTQTMVADTAAVVYGRMDVTDSNQIAEFVTETESRWGRIDLLVNNAGVIADHLSWRLADEDWNRVFEVNLSGPARCCRAVLPSMMSNRRGQVVNISSFSARHGHVGQSHYAAAKAGLLGLTQALAAEVGHADIQVNAVLPGAMPTSMLRDLSNKRKHELAQANALGRLNTTREVARFVAFLATTRNISGQLFQLDSRIARWT